MEGFRNPGVILPNPPVNDGFNNHHSIFQFKVNGILPIITVKLPMRITNRISALVNICAVYA